VAKRDKRNYSFLQSKRIPDDKITDISGIKIPAVPGTCYHAIMCVLARDKDKFCPWSKLIENVQRYMMQYGGRSAWDRFVNRAGAQKSPEQRIKDNTHTLTRTGNNCYGRRLHERGCTIYYFRDGAMLVTGGKFVEKPNGKYDVEFPDGKRLQKRHRGLTLTFREYKRFCSMNLIDSSCNIVDKGGIRKAKLEAAMYGAEDTLSKRMTPQMVGVTVQLSEKYDQKTAYRLKEIGFVVNSASGSTLVGKVVADNINALAKDPDVVNVEVQDVEALAVA